MVLQAAIPTLASALGGLFGKKKKGGQSVSLQPLRTSGQNQVGDLLSTYYKNNLANFQPGASFGNSQIGASSLENSTQALLENFLKGDGTGALFDQASGHISDTLSGKFANPATSPYIQSQTDLANINLRDQIDASRAGTGARGNYFGSQSIEEEGRLRGDTLAGLQGVIGQFIQNERQNQLGAVNTAKQFDQHQNLAVPLAQLEAGSTIGALNRNLEEGDYERAYRDFARQQSEGQNTVAGAQNFFSPGAQYGVKDFQAPTVQQNNTLGNIMELIGNLNYKNVNGKNTVPGNLMRILQDSFGG